MDIKFDQMKKLGIQLKGKRVRYEGDRDNIETQWLQNLRQYMRQYDPKIKEKMKKDRSQAYPGDTRVKVQSEVAKMMEMMFPALERNWELSVSPVPSIAKTDLDKIIDQLETAEEVAAQQEEREPGPIQSESIERAVKAFAEERKKDMEAEIADQLEDPLTDYPQMLKRAVRSGTIYGIGIVRSPQVRTLKEREFEIDEATGRYQAVEKKVRRPYPEFVRCWDYYPDLSARVWEDQEGGFERVVVNRNDFAAFADRPDFRADIIKQYLKDNSIGNYTARTYESELQTISDESNFTDRNSRRYEVYRWLGFISGHDLDEAGVSVKPSELADMHFADVWIIDDIVIKAEKASFGSRVSDVYHAYIPAEDEDSGLTGVGLPEDVRDSQMSICATNRALMDNMAAVAGPIIEVNQDLLPSGRKSVGSIHAFMTIESDHAGISGTARAVNALFIPSHISELLSILEMQRQQLDIESNIPSWTQGVNPGQLGEAFRTSGNMSAMTGGANMTTKDRVRAFDKLTVGVITSMLKWNMEFNPKEDIKGDFGARGRGNISLVAKEVRGAALDQMTAQFTPEEQAMVDAYGLLEDKFESRDLPKTRLLPRETALKNVQSMKEAQAAAQQAEAGLTGAKTNKENAQAGKLEADAQATGQTTEALIENLLAQAENSLAQAEGSKEKGRLENLKLLLEGALKDGES